MIIKDEVITLEWTLRTTHNEATYASASYFDLQITAPDGAVEYKEGSTGQGWIKTYVAPTDTTEGKIEYEWEPKQEGVYTLILGEGTSPSFNIIKTSILLVVKKDTVHNTYVKLPT